MGKNLIYQYWTVMPGKKLPPAVEVGKKFMSDYAESIGADYKFSLNPKWDSKCSIPEYYNAFEPIFNPEYYENYDNVLFCDLDIIPVDDMTENIFDQDIVDMGICREKHKEEIRQTTDSRINAKADEMWNNILVREFDTEMPRNKKGQMKVFNTGVVLYTKAGMEKARKNWVPFQKYINKMQGLNRFYSIDQNYLHAMMHIGKMDYTEMDEGWNSYVHYHGPEGITGKRPVWDCRTKNTKFVHVQLRNADNQDYEWHRTIANRPVSEWDI